ncbi:uncharacterized protein LOC133188966 [Saccostrea echinata]|uniref:uncharacterized protein LOC133188966 n=1 Tax=Saccostrea echinata TaxID=191078 RepID=UPI002A821FE9|nr:uncharacterized protein LOC133188966 [Saccostrea echinata]
MSGKSTVSDIAEYFTSKIAEDDKADNDTFVSESPSFLELHYLDLQKRDPDNPHLTITLDFDVSSQLNCAKTWKMSLLNLISINPELRTLLQETEQGMKRANIQKFIIDIEDVSFHFISVSSKEEFENASDSISKFNPYVDIPLKAVFWKSSSFGILRLVINHGSFDNGCVIAIVKDLQYIFTQYLLHQSAPVMLTRQPVDPALAMERLLNERMDELKTYWNMELLKCREPQSFQMIKKVEERSPGNISEVITKLLNVDQLKKLEEVSTENHSTLFTLFCTAFQVAIHKQLHCHRTCVIAAADTRMHLPEFRERPVLCVNYIPIVSTDMVNPSLSFYDILKANKNIIAQGISKSLFPFKLMREMPAFVEDIHKVHSIVMEDLTLWNVFNTSQIQLSKFGVEQDSSYETNLSVILHSNKSLELKLRYSVQKVGRYLAENILEHIEAILENSVSDIHFNIFTWRSLCKIEQEIESLADEYFFLYNRNGKVRKKKIFIINHPTFALEWGKKRTWRIPTSEMVLITGFNAQDFHGIYIKTLHSEERLLLKDRKRRDAWIAVLRRKVAEHFEEKYESTKL